MPFGQRQAALDTGLVVVGIDSVDHDVVTVAVPPLRDNDPDGTKLDHLQPIFVSTISNGGDLTLLLGVEGSVNVSGAVTLELHYPDGFATTIPIAADRSYHFAVPTERQHDFASATGQLIAKNAVGDAVAVSSVANTRPAG